MKQLLLFLTASIFVIGCNEAPKSDSGNTEPSEANSKLVIEASVFNGMKEGAIRIEEKVVLPPEHWASYNVRIPETGRYRVTFSIQTDTGSVWMEDYINNTDDRTYDVTGKVSVQENGNASIEGSPFQKGLHDIKIHAYQDTVVLSSFSFELIQSFVITPDTMVQSTDGKEWNLVWSDEFEYSGLPDSTKWSYNIGNWGWGNNELQYYTLADTNNALVDNGVLRIRGVKDNGIWSSARLTTQGKTTFLYGKMDIRAKVPVKRGTWAAGWMLGDSYRDEISWPYCGEIDVLECVGYEINDTTGSGLNHATCHTPAYYFKKGNQIGSNIEVDSMNTQFHNYTLEWYPDEIKCFLDGEHYYTYDKTADSLEWPFFQPQNIILNLAIGGGWGGAKGLDPTLQQQDYIIDYVRVFEKK